MGADEGGDEIIKSGAGANFVVGMLGSGADLAVGQELTGKALAKNEELDGFAQRDFAVVQGDVFLAPGHFELVSMESIEISSESFWKPSSLSSMPL